MTVKLLRSKATVALCSLAVTATLAGAAERGFLGISYSIDGEGFVFNRIVKSVKVNNVVLRSPASREGIRIGDEILEVDGKRIPGSRVSELKPLLDKQAGQTIRIVLRKSSGQTHTVRVALEARPPE
jgi:C-terminal processing protease CtpA/Prc